MLKLVSGAKHGSGSTVRRDHIITTFNQVRHHVCLPVTSASPIPPAVDRPERHILCSERDTSWMEIQHTPSTIQEALGPEHDRSPGVEGEGGIIPCATTLAPAPVHKLGFFRGGIKQREIRRRFRPAQSHLRLRTGSSHTKKAQLTS